MTEHRYDAIVIGAGLAGLTAAEQLVGQGLEVRVLEARDRVGGRTCSRTVANQAVDMGAEHIGPNHKEMLALTKRLGIPIRDSGLFRAKTRWQIGDNDRVGNVPPVSIGQLLRSGALMARLAREARKLPVDEPWTAPSAVELDRLSLADWLDAARISGPARRLHEALWEDGFTVEAERISMLQLIWTVRRSGGVVSAIRDTIGYEVDGGTQTIANALTQRLGPRVVLEKPVKSIEQDADEVSVVSADGASYRGGRAIVAVPVPTLRSIDFSPALPDPVADAHEEIAFGRATTIIVGSSSAHAAAFGFVVGNPAFGAAWRRGKTVKTKPRDVAGDRVGEVAEEVARAAQIPAEGRDCESFDWTSDPYTRGTYVNFAPGQLTRFGPHLREKHGRVVFASAERSSWPTFMEGAVESGKRAATNVAAAITASR